MEFRWLLESIHQIFHGRARVPLLTEIEYEKAEELGIPAGGSQAALKMQRYRGRRIFCCVSNATLDFCCLPNAFLQTQKRF